MVPQMMLPLAAIGITGLYAVWHRYRPVRTHGPDQLLRERVAYMLWISATRA